MDWKKTGGTRIQLRVLVARCRAAILIHWMNLLSHPDRFKGAFLTSARMSGIGEMRVSLSAGYLLWMGFSDD
jgi:hypothetical protein